MNDNVLRINENDNVAIARCAIGRGDAVVLGGVKLFDAAEDVRAGHKIAMSEIAAGEYVVRYGEDIVEATEKIGPGQWVHVHNTRPIDGHVEL
jgi:altronate hydrolase